jgi:site-specific DNA-adenine methylase
MKYTGSKGGSGVVEWLINNIPYHKRYFELFAGSAKLYYAKRAAEQSFLTDLNPVIIEYHKAQALVNTTIENKSALDILQGTAYEPLHPEFKWTLDFQFTRDDVIYLDPPYPAKSRFDKQTELYDYEMSECIIRLTVA